MDNNSEKKVFEDTLQPIPEEKNLVERIRDTFKKPRIFVPIAILIFAGFLFWVLRSPDNIVLSPTPTPIPASMPEFRSGFESDTNVTHFANRNRWATSISGTDFSTGYTWPDDLSAQSKSRFNYLIRSGLNLDDFAATRIEEVMGHDGSPTRALYQEIKKDDSLVSNISRNQFDLFPNTGEDFKEGAISYWIKLQPNLSDVFQCQGCDWRNMMEFREVDDTYRIVFSLIREGGQVFWRASGQSKTQLQPGDPKRGDWYVDWDAENTQVPIPIGEWFFWETYFKRDSTDGRFIVKINGNTVADFSGRTMNGNPLVAWQIFKVYTAKEILDAGFSAYQWIDDVNLCLGSDCSL